MQEQNPKIWLFCALWLIQFSEFLSWTLFSLSGSCSCRAPVPGMETHIPVIFLDLSSKYLPCSKSWGAAWMFTPYIGSCPLREHHNWNTPHKWMIWNMNLTHNCFPVEFNVEMLTQSNTYKMHNTQISLQIIKT